MKNNSPNFFCTSVCNFVANETSSSGSCMGNWTGSSGCGWKTTWATSSGISIFCIGACWTCVAGIGAGLGICGATGADDWTVGTWFGEVGNYLF